MTSPWPWQLKLPRFSSCGFYLEIQASSHSSSSRLKLTMPLAAAAASTATSAAREIAATETINLDSSRLVSSGSAAAGHYSFTGYHRC